MGTENMSGAGEGSGYKQGTGNFGGDGDSLSLD